jgi:hypothetical protein
MSKNYVIIGLLTLVIAGCQTTPAHQFTVGHVLWKDDFGTAFGWDHFTVGGVQVGPEGGAYEMRADTNQYVRGFNPSADTVADSVIEVQTMQLSAHDNNAYGVICRGALNNNAAGYYFLIGGDGSYSIRKGQADDVEALVGWSRTTAINRESNKNTIKAVCIDDYLALYINDKFVAATHDSAFKSGYTGFVVAVSQGHEIDVIFDDLVIHEASLLEEK